VLYCKLGKGASIKAKIFKGPEFFIDKAILHEKNMVVVRSFVERLFDFFKVLGFLILSFLVSSF